MNDLRREIEAAINRNCAEKGSDTPDWILAQYLLDCLASFDRAVMSREAWYGRRMKQDPILLFFSGCMCLKNKDNDGEFCKVHAPGSAAR